MRPRLLFRIWSVFTRAWCWEQLLTVGSVGDSGTVVVMSLHCGDAMPSRVDWFSPTRERVLLPCPVRSLILMPDPQHPGTCKKVGVTGHKASNSCPLGGSLALQISAALSLSWKKRAFESFTFSFDKGTVKHYFVAEWKPKKMCSAVPVLGIYQKYFREKARRHYILGNPGNPFFFPLGTHIISLSPSLLSTQFSL